jgi:fructose-1,6-bisphosphatase/inositol monophosphatase family enzyme
VLLINIDQDKVIEIICESAAQEIMPLWQNLRNHQVVEKQADDLVTVADGACEERLTKELLALLPGSLVIGEEAVHADPGVLAALDSVRPVWVVDPLDGTNNFARGESPFAVMVCLIQNRETLAAWIYDPLQASMLRAEKGAGVFLDEKQVRLQPFEGVTSSISGALSVKYLPQAMRPFAIDGSTRLGHTAASGCAGFDYRQMVLDTYQFQFYYRTLPWDHAPGALIVSEAGGVALRYDGSPYRPTSDGTGLITACDQQTWGTVRKLLVA